MRALETSVERAIKRWANGHKEVLMYWKFQVPGLRGVPDRIALFRGGHVVFFELKRPGGKPRKLQVWLHKKLRKFGFPCHVFDSADAAIRELERYVELYSGEAKLGPEGTPSDGPRTNGDARSGGAVP